MLKKLRHQVRWVSKRKNSTTTSTRDKRKQKGTTMSKETKWMLKILTTTSMMWIKFDL
jgi:hypothetical protein